VPSSASELSPSSPERNLTPLQDATISTLIRDSGEARSLNERGVGGGEGNASRMDVGLSLFGLVGDKGVNESGGGLLALNCRNWGGSSGEGGGVRRVASVTAKESQFGGRWSGGSVGGERLRLGVSFSEDDDEDEGRREER